MTESNDAPKPKQVNFHCSQELWAEMKTRSINDNIPMRVVIMRALSAFGFKVASADLEDKRK